MIRRPPRSTRVRSSAASDVYKRQALAAHLGEVAHRDVGPEVRAEIVQDPVEAGHVAVELSLPVVALDLGGQRVPGQAKGLYERLADRGPVRAGYRRNVCAIRAGRPVELSEVLRAADPGELSL